MKNENQEALSLIVRTREDFQEIRKTINSRLGFKDVKLVGKKGQKRLIYEDQNIERRSFNEEDLHKLVTLSLASMLDEKKAEVILNDILKRFKIYNEFLNTSKASGCADITSGWMLGEFDIHEATTVSKMWQFAGFNPGLIRGKKSVAKSDYKESMGEIIKELPPFKNGKKRYCVLTNELIRGDKKTKGFLCPYNTNLKRVLMGITATSMIKAQGYYVHEYYYPEKSRLANSDREVLHLGKMTPWKDVSPGHRDFAAKRKMIKAFLTDFYVAWRTCEGLPVRKPYCEEYLGKKHQMKISR